MARSLALDRRRGAACVLLVMIGSLSGCATKPTASEAEVRQRVRFEDGPEGARAILSESILFEVGKTTFARAADPVLDTLKPAFARARGTIIVEGHTDRTGSDAFNRRLSIERAETVRAAIVARQVPPHRVQARGLGKDRPRRSPEVSDQDRQLNRRAEILFPGETVDTLGGREIEGNVDTVLANLGKALQQAKEQVTGGAKSVFETIRDRIKGDGKP